MVENYLNKFLNFTIEYNIKKDSETFVKLSDQLSKLSNLKLKDWNLKIERGRLQIFQLFERFEPHFTLNDGRFEIFVSRHAIKVNFPEEDFFHVKGPKRYYRVSGFPSKEAKKHVSEEELEKIDSLVSLILLSKMGVSYEEDLENISVYFILKLDKPFNYKKVEKVIFESGLEIEAIDLNFRKKGVKFMLEIENKEFIKGKMIFSNLDPQATSKILSKVKTLINEFQRKWD